VAAVDTTFWQQITAMVGLVVFLIVFLVVFWEWRRRHPIAAPPKLELGEQVERRRAEMAEAEVRALHQANLALHEEVDRLRRHSGPSLETQTKTESRALGFEVSPAEEHRR